VVQPTVRRVIANGDAALAQSGKAERTWPSTVGAVLLAPSCNSMLRFEDDASSPWTLRGQTDPPTTIYDRDPTRFPARTLAPEPPSLIFYLLRHDDAVALLAAGESRVCGLSDDRDLHPSRGQNLTACLGPAQSLDQAHPWDCAGRDLGAIVRPVTFDLCIAPLPLSGTHDCISSSAELPAFGPDVTITGRPARARRYLAAVWREVGLLPGQQRLPAPRQPPRSGLGERIAQFVLTLPNFDDLSGNAVGIRRKSLAALWITSLWLI